MMLLTAVTGKKANNAFGSNRIIFCCVIVSFFAVGPFPFLLFRCANLVVVSFQSVFCLALP